VAIKLEPNARSISAHVLDRVFGEDAYAAAVLDAALERYPELDPRERALATELSYGALRTASYLESRLSKHAPKGTSKLDRTVRVHLLVAAYQLLCLDRVPAFAAVSEAVRQITRARGKRVGSFANAILRRLSEEAATSDKRATLEAAVQQSISRELRDALVRSVGDAEADALVDTTLASSVGLRVRWGDDRDAWVKRLADVAKDATIRAGRVSPLAIVVHGGRDPEKMASYAEGHVAIQEEGAQVVTLALGASRGETILDACAGRGNKSALLAELVGPDGAVDAADQHPQKLERLREELARLHASPRATFAVDWTVGPGDVPSSYDRVLVDAPCSGTGTIGRRPDLATRWRASVVSELREIQWKILLAAAERAKPGAAVLYAVCSVLREEGELVVERALAAAPWLEPAPFPGEPARTLAAGATALRLTPRAHGTDGYFLASFRRRAQRVI
jgi:16S rRNA (cytosine967-C5)-methyltransferase